MNRGVYYKQKTKKWFIKKGYQCEYTETLRRIFTKKGLIYIKKDLFGADMLAFNEDGYIFANAKFGRNNLSAGLKEFRKFNFPKVKKVEHWLVVWELRVREPEIIVYEEVGEK